MLSLLIGCTQKPARVVRKGTGVYHPNYSEVYVESPDGKIARSLRGYNDAEKAQEVSIISRPNAEKNFSKTSIYTVQNGDNLSSIARKYSMSTSDLASVNNINKPYNLRIGQKLKVNNINDSEEKIVIKKPTTYIVQSGDNISIIANKYGMNKSDLISLNNLKSPYNVYVGQKLKINQSINNNYSEDGTQTKEIKSKEAKFYIVKNGDNLSSIARNNNTSSKELISLNSLKAPYNIYIGQKIKVGEKIVVKKVITKEKNNYDQQQLNTTTTVHKDNQFIWPIKGSILSDFGNKANGLYNDGINISAPEGTPFKSAEQGVVAYVGNELRGYGTIILIKHNSNWISAYAHCDGVKVSRGDMVNKGQIIGTVGKSGNVDAPQLYFSLRSGRKAVDPIKYLN